MGTSSGDRGPDNFVVADGAQERLLAELAGSKKLPAETDVSLKSPKEEVPLVFSHLKDSEVTPVMKFTEFQKVDENQDPLKDRGGKGSEGEGVLANKNSFTTETQLPENSDGDLPSFSIKRLRRLPLRVASDQVCGTSDTKEEPMIAELSAVNTGNGKEPKQVLGEGQAKDLDDGVVKCVSITSPSVLIEENSSREKIYSDPRVIGLGDLSGDGLDLKNDVRSKATARNEEQKQVIGENPIKSAEDGLVSADPVNLAVLQSDRIMNQREIPTQPLEVGVADPGDEGSQYRKELPSSGLVESVPHNLLTGGQDAGNDLNKDLFEGREEDLGVIEIPAKSIGMGDDSDQWRNVFDSYNTESISQMKPPALQLHVDDSEKENVAPATPIEVLVSSPEKEDMPEQVPHELSSPASSTNTDLQDAQPSGFKEAGGKPDMFALPASSETVMASPSGTVQILPLVIADTYASISAAETTDEEDSPWGSIGFAIPDGEPDLTPLPYSGQIMYPGRYSTFQSTSGPSLLQYSGSMSLRSDSSTTSNRSFAFPVLAPEWNSSPVRMAKADPRYLRRRRRWDGCCFPRLGRSTYKY